MTRRMWLLVVMILLAALPGVQAEAGRVDTPAPQPRGDALEREARQIETMLVAPCCWREQVSVHQSEASDQVKQEIRAMLAAGLTRQQVLDRFVSSYGTRILAEPPDAGFGRILHHLPWMIGVMSLAGLLVFVRRVTRRAPVREPGAASLASPSLTERRYEERLDDELRDLD